MNSFCNNLNLNISPLRPNIDINDFPLQYRNLIPKSYVNLELIEYLNARGIIIKQTAMFYAEGPDESFIHLDGIHITDAVKISWAYGNDHSMNWYTTNVKRTFSIHKVDTYFTNYELQDVTLIHSQKVGCPSLVLAGTPHNVSTYSGTRKTITMVLFNKKTRQFLKMAEALIMFNDIIE
jgi:hypothetical protein